MAKKKVKFAWLREYGLEPLAGKNGKRFKHGLYRNRPTYLEKCTCRDGCGIVWAKFVDDDTICWPQTWALTAKNNRMSFEEVRDILLQPTKIYVLVIAIRG